MIPAWGNSNGSHTWVQPIERKFNYRKQIENFCREIPKVYRQTYSKQIELLPVEREELIPNFFQNPYLKDVTDEYISVTQIEEQGFPKNVRYGYLCVFNQFQWKPVAQAIIQSGTCVFPKMSMNIVYLPAYFQNDELIPIAPPFILRHKGERINHEQTDKIHKDTDNTPFNKQNLSDNNILTYSLLNEESSYSFLLTDTIASIRLLPASDGNGIYPSDEYELFYFDKALEWVSCGKQKATSYHLSYQQIPKGALFWLRNLTTDKEERIFTYKEGKQFFW